MSSSAKATKLRAYRELYDYLKLFTDKLAVDNTWRVSAEKPTISVSVLLIQSLQSFFIGEGAIKWLLEDDSDRPRYRVRITEMTPVGKKCATSATLLEVTSALLLEMSPKSLLEVSLKGLQEVSPKLPLEVSPKWHIFSRRESLPRPECVIAEVTSGKVAEVTPRSTAKACL